MTTNKNMISSRSPVVQFNSQPLIVIIGADCHSSWRRRTLKVLPSTVHTTAVAEQILHPHLLNYTLLFLFVSLSSHCFIH